MAAAFRAAEVEVLKDLLHSTLCHILSLGGGSSRLRGGRSRAYVLKIARFTLQ